MSRVLALYETDHESTVVVHGDGGRVLCRVPARANGGAGRIEVAGDAAVVTVARGGATPFLRVDLATGAVADAAPPVPGEAPPWAARCRAHPGGVLSAVVRRDDRRELWLHAGGSWSREPLPPSFEVYDVAVEGSSVLASGRIRGPRPKAAVLSREGPGEWALAFSSRGPSVYDTVLRDGPAVAAWGDHEEWGRLDGTVVVGAGNGPWHEVRVDGGALAGLLRTDDGAVAVTARGYGVPAAGGQLRPVPGLVAALAALPGDDVLLRRVRGDGDSVVAIAHPLSGGRAAASAVLASRDGGATYDVVATSQPGSPRPVDVALAR